MRRVLSKKEKAEVELAKNQAMMEKIKKRIEKQNTLIKEESEDELDMKVTISAKRFKQYQELLAKV